jgi:ATPase subunit of ABC transporter with duplicated ATPase domains
MEQMPQYDEYMTLSFMYNSANPSKKVVLNVTIPELVVENKKLSQNIHIEIAGNQKVAILGSNGSGKTTLLRSIYQLATETESEVKIAYIPQNYDEYFDLSMTPITFLKNKVDENTLEEGMSIETYLSVLKFSRDDMLKPIGSLSYGQKVKIILLDLTLNYYNLLILDELTRNLSPLSITVINQLFKNFPGAILAVTHDRAFLDEVIERKLYLTKDGLNEE